MISIKIEHKLHTIVATLLEAMEEVNQVTANKVTRNTLRGNI